MKDSNGDEAQHYTECWLTTPNVQAVRAAESGSRTSDVLAVIFHPFGGWIERKLFLSDEAASIVPTMRQRSRPQERVTQVCPPKRCEAHRKGDITYMSRPAPSR
jgi:hypothetical protein